MRRRRGGDDKSRAVGNWEKLVGSALATGELRGSSRPERDDDLGGGTVPPSLGQNDGQESNINDILQAAEEIQPHDAQVARILCEYAYNMAQNLDPQSEGRGVLQFKTGLLSVIRQKQSKREGERIDRSHDIQHIQRFYELYRTTNRIEELERRQKETGVLHEDPVEHERRTQRLKKVYQTSRVLNIVLNALTRDSTPEERDNWIQKELKDTMEMDAKKTADFKAYNILPLETPGVADAIMSFEEVKAAAASLAHTDELPQFPGDYRKPVSRDVDIFDLLEYIFGFQEGNVNNQREHLILLLSNSQSLLSVPTEGLMLDESAITRCFERLLDNYIKWCNYLRIDPMTDRAVTGQRKLILMGMYLLIWGEAANLRFLPECLCYIFHQMVTELYGILEGRDVQRSKTYKTYEKDGKQYSYLDQVVTPIYQTVLAEAKNNKGGKASHAAWRNYDDFNEFFWSSRCFVLQWPWRSDAGFFMKPRKKGVAIEGGKGAGLVPGQRREKRVGKMTFVEHRTYFHIFHSFHRLWIFFTVMLQAMMVVAFCDEKLNTRTFKKMLSVGPTYLIMKTVQSLFDLTFIYGAYGSTQGWTFSRIFTRLLFYGGLAAGILFLYIKMIQEDSQGAATTWYNLFLIVLGSYAGAQLLATAVLRIPFFRRQTDKCSNWGIIRFIYWVHQDRYFVGRGLYERSRDYLGYTAFWVFVLACKFAFSYHFQIRSLVSPTKTIVNLSSNALQYKWHDFFSAKNHNALTVASIWAPVIMIYYLDTQVWYTVTSALVGGLSGARARLGEIRALSMLRKRFSTFPEEMARNLFPSRVQTQQLNRVQSSLRGQAGWPKAKVDAFKFSPIWNAIIISLREEDYINNREKELLLMPSNHGASNMVQWPLFLLANKVYMAVEMAQDNKSTNQIGLWERIEKDEYMAYAVKEAYNTLETVLKALVNNEAKTWVRSVFGDVEGGIQESMLVGHFHLRQVDQVLSRIQVLTALLIHDEDKDGKKKAVIAMQDLYETVLHDFLSADLREKFQGWTLLSQAKNEGRLFANLNWPQTIEEKEAVKRLHNLLTIKESSANIPRNLEARRRLQFFTNSLFMHMPVAPPVRQMLSFSVFTPYYEEDVMYSKEQVKVENEDGISILFYLQKIFPDEWKNFQERIGLTNAVIDAQLKNISLDMLELRLWASFRGQTLARTVRGMMYYKKALVLASLLEEPTADIEEGLQSFAGTGDSNPGFRRARALAELKFTYVLTCQIYGVQKQKRDVRAADISYLMKKYESLRIAYIDMVESMKDEKSSMQYYSKLIKADVDGNDQEIYSIKLPGEFRLGEGKPENQNHAIVFTRGDAVQTIDMNQDMSFEEAFKMRNLLEEFKAENCLRRPTILGIRENVFTGSVSSLAWFMSQQETSFVTLGQRVLAHPLKIRMHYGHPDVFDRIFHITRGGISKASKTINISEDIYAGFNSTLRQGNVTHHEYIQVGKGRDVGLNQIAIFEAKVSGGNGEQILSRDVFRLGQLLDFFRMLSFFYTSVGYYITTLMTSLVIYLFLYGKCYLALSGLDRQLQIVADISGNAALSSALNTQFLLQIGVFTAVPMIVNFILEQGFLKAVTSFITMQLQLCSVFFTFSLGTKTHYFGRTVLHGGAKYSATGRGFVVRHIPFADNYRLYSRSHFTKALEIAMLLIVYLAYGEDNSGLTYILLSFSSWFLALSWLFAPYIFNPSGFEWQKTVEDFDDWTNWLFYKGGISVKGAESWESWLEEEQVHIKTWRGRIWEIVLSLRFFFFQYGVVYSLSVSGSSTSLAVYGYSWIVFVGIVILFKIFTFTSQASVNFQLFLRLFQGVLMLGIITAVVVVIVKTSLTVGDCFALLLAFIPTGWGLLSIAVALKKYLELMHIWGFLLSSFRLYDAMMGAVIFTPIAILSWLPFVSTFQTRLVFNQAFSRGLEISLILAGNRPNAST